MKQATLNLEPPWVVAARTLSWDEKTLEGMSVSAVEQVVKEACEAHAAALAQERDRAVALLDRIKETAMASWQSTCIHHNDKERELTSGECPVCMRATVARLTAERDRLRAALEVARDYLATNKRESNRTLLAQIDAALAPTQKEEA